MNVESKMDKDAAVNLLSDKLTKLCEQIAAILVLASKDESQLLDGIKIASDGIRTLACNGFVRMQKIKGKS